MSQDARLARALAEGASPAVIDILRSLLACACASAATGPTGGADPDIDYNGRLAAFDQFPPGPFTVPDDAVTPTTLFTQVFTVPLDAPAGTLLDIRGWVNALTNTTASFTGNLQVGINGAGSVILAQGGDQTGAAGGDVQLAMEGVLPVTAGDVVTVLFLVLSSGSVAFIDSTPGDSNSTDAWLISEYTSLA